MIILICILLLMIGFAFGYDFCNITIGSDLRHERSKLRAKVDKYKALVDFYKAKEKEEE